MGVVVKWASGVRRLASLAVVTWALAVSSALAQTGDSSVVYDGAASVSIANADQAAARDKALAQALHDAVSKAVVGLVGEEVAASRQTQIERAVLVRSRAFVTGYQVVQEGADAGDYRVAVQARVAIEAVRRAVQALDAPPAPDSTQVASQEPGPGTEASADVFLRGGLTAERYRAIRAFLERRVPGVRVVSVVSLEPGAIALRLRGAFPASALSGYLSQADFGTFRLAVTRAEVGPDLEVVVRDAEAPR